MTHRTCLSLAVFLALSSSLLAGCSNKIQIVKHDGTVIRGRLVRETAGALVVEGKVVREGKLARAAEPASGPRLNDVSPYVSTDRKPGTQKQHTHTVSVDEVASLKRGVNGAAIGVAAGLVGIVGSALLISAITADDDPSYESDGDRDGAALLFFLCLYAC